MFEKGASPSSNPNSPKYPATRTLSGKNFHALKSQFDKSNSPNSPTSPPPPVLEEEPTSPPPPPPRSAPPSSPPAVPKRSSVTSKPSPVKAKVSPKTSPVSSGKTSPTGSKTTSTSGGRKSPPSQSLRNKAATPPVVKATPTKKKPMGSSPTTPIPRNVVKKPVSRTTSSPIHQQHSQSPPSGAGGPVKKPSTKIITEAPSSPSSPPPPSQTQQQQPLKKPSLPSMEVDNTNNNTSLEAPTVTEKMPIIEVSLETPPSATSTPINLNTKPEPPISVTDADLKVVNKNFINSAVTGGNRYWTNQALQNDNSTKISQVDLVIITEA